MTYSEVHSNNTQGETDFFNTSENFVQAVMSYSIPPVTNFGQPSEFGFQTPQNNQNNQTPVVFQTPPTSSVQQVPTTSAPHWAIQLIEDVKTIKAALPKIDKIESSILEMCHKITKIESNIKDLDTKVKDVEKSVSFIDSEYENQKRDLKENKEHIETLKQALSKTKHQNEEIQDKFLDLESRSMRENLIFYGIQEPTTNNGTLQPENCDSLVKQFITEHLHTDGNNIVLDRAHRLGGPKSRKPRPIVVKFHKYSDREDVRLKSYNATIKTSLANMNLGVGIQSPQQYRDARKELKDYAKQEQDKGKKARIIGNKLYVNNKDTLKYVDGQIRDQRQPEY